MRFKISKPKLIHYNFYVKTFIESSQKLAFISLYLCSSLMLTILQINKKINSLF
nr:MAG TPA: hypothetical protein [Caudoviricetes sp.]